MKIGKQFISKFVMSVQFSFTIQQSVAIIERRSPMGKFFNKRI